MTNDEDPRRDRGRLTFVVGGPTDLATDLAARGHGRGGVVVVTTGQDPTALSRLLPRGAELLVVGPSFGHRRQMRYAIASARGQVAGLALSLDTIALPIGRAVLNLGAPGCLFWAIGSVWQRNETLSALAQAVAICRQAAPTAEQRFYVTRPLLPQMARQILSLPSPMSSMVA